jgi:dihydrofolate reductase
MREKNHEQSFRQHWTQPRRLHGAGRDDHGKSRVQKLGRQVGCPDGLAPQATVPGGETGPVNDLVRSTVERTGASIMGKRMFDQGERSWPEDAPFHTPVYVLTNEKREPWVRPGGTTFYFINEGPERALELARESAGRRDVRIAGGADVIQQYLNLDAVDELEIALAPVLFGGGRRLFENLREPGPQFRIDKVLDGPAATHLRYVRQ